MKGEGRSQVNCEQKTVQVLGPHLWVKNCNFSVLTKAILKLSDMYFRIKQTIKYVATRNKGSCGRRKDIKHEMGKAREREAWMKQTRNFYTIYERAYT